MSRAVAPADWLRRAVAPQLEAPLPRVRGGASGWRAVAALAVRHGLAGLVSSRRSVWPEEAHESLAGLLGSARRRALAVALRAATAAADAAGALEGAGLGPVVAFKGLALAATAYGGDLGARNMTDADLLVRAEVSLADVGQVLERAGFRPVAQLPPHRVLGRLRAHAATYLHPGGGLVDVHRRAGYPPLHPRAGRGLFDRVRRLPAHPWLRASLWAPAPEDHLVVLAMHVLHDGLSGPWRQWVDVAWLIAGERPDLGVAWQVARAWGARRALWAALVVSRAFGAPVSVGWLARHAPGPLASCTVLYRVLALPSASPQTLSARFRTQAWAWAALSDCRVAAAARLGARLAARPVERALYWASSSGIRVRHTQGQPKAER